ncbi:hypothetical protein APR04_003611 [Promicromonospora umidemergens]|uniref:Glycerophosphoryl diester phosphodiesterase family protein n=1 Tax=Promicromonospora umidemergens TaxID=629679 RepID=A0ABP8Y906_9MICO|nr:hypothetical protein [Promicromonospora umidemergens]MCP2284688.1 hypothetical protein [Promicromonospora umidemergens]
MTTPESAPDQPAQPTPPQSGGSQPAGWGEPPRYGQYAPGYDAAAPPAQDQPQYGTPQTGIPQYGTPQGEQAAQYGQSQYGQYSPSSPQVPGYRPLADKPGIVPLRPLSLGELYDGAFGAVRHNPGVTLGLTAIIVVFAVAVGTLISIPLTTLFTDLFAGFFAEVGSDPALEGLGFTQDMLGVTYGSALGIGLLVSLAMPLAMGVMAIAVSDSVIGRKIPLSEAWRRVVKRAWFLIGFSLLSGLAAYLIFFLAIGIVIAAFAVDPTLGGISVLVVLAGLVVSFAWLLTRVALIPPALAVEGGGFWATCARAWKLTRGTFWRVLGIYLLTVIIMWIISNIVLVPLQFAMSFLLVTANDVGIAISYGLSSVISGGLSALFVGGVIALLYIDTRMRREGLDVQLQTAAATAAEQ